MLSMLLMDAFMLFIPLSIGFAVLRSRLFDLDVVINRTLVYGSLTAMLVVLYFGGIVLLQRVFVVFTGQEDRKSTRLNSSHANISYAVFCLQKKNILPCQCALSQ